MGLFIIRFFKRNLQSFLVGTTHDTLTKHENVNNLVFPAFSHFSWNTMQDILTFDVLPIQVNHLCQALSKSIQDLEAMLEPVIHGFNPKEIYNLINNKLNPKKPTLWFQDNT